MTGVVPALPDIRAVFHPEGIQTTARDAVRAAARRLVERGGRVQVRRPVTEVGPRAWCVTGVKTTTGPVSTDTVVLAAAMWTNAYSTLAPGACRMHRSVPSGLRASR